MNISGWIQLAFFIGVLLLITKPLGIYLFQVLDANGRTFLDPVIKPFERLTYRLIGVDPEKEQGWILYTIAMLIFSRRLTPPGMPATPCPADGRGFG